MQRMIPHPEPLPSCRAGHAARHIHDTRRADAGGGHQIECRCSATARHGEYDDALREWCQLHGHPLPALTPQRALPLNVTPLRRA